MLPVAHTERWGGSFMPTRYEDLFNIARDIQHFSSRNVLVADVAPPPDGAEPGAEGITPYNVGRAADHIGPAGTNMGQKAPASAVLGERRRQVGSPRRARCAPRSSTALLVKGHADGAADYAQQIPPRVIASMLGIPKEMAGTFTEWGARHPRVRSD